MMKRLARILLASIFWTSALLLPQEAAAQSGGAVSIKAIDTATGATTDVGDNTNHAVRVNIVSGAGSGGTALTDNTAFTQGSTSVTPVAALYATSWTNPTAGRASIVRMDINGGAYVNIDKVGTSAITLGSKTSASSFPVVIASDQGALSVSQSGTWTVQPGNTPNTAQWLVKAGPFDACGTTTYDPASVKIPDATLDTLTSTTTCVDTIAVTNVGSAQATITVQDQQGTAVQILNTLPVAPGATTVLNLGGLKFTSGIKYQASASNTLSIWVKGRQ